MLRPWLARLAAALTLVSWGAPAEAQAVSPAPASVSGPAALSAQLVPIQRVVSPGGIEAWLIEDHSQPIISLQFALRGGMSLDPPGKAGLAEFAAVTLDEGAGELDSQAFQKRLADDAIGLAFLAGRDWFMGSLQTVTENREAAYELFRLALTAPRFDDEPLGRMRAALISAWRRGVADPNWLGSRAMSRLQFDGHPYGEPGSGTPATLSALTAEDLRAWAGRQLTRDRLLVAAAGDLTPDELALALDHIFGGLPATGPAAAVPPATLSGAGLVLLVARPDLPQTFFRLQAGGIDRQDPDWHAAEIANYILGGGGFASRLMEEVREKRGLTYGVSSYIFTLEQAAIVGVSGSTKNESAGEALDLIRAELSRMAEGGVTAEELADAQTFLTGSFPLRLTSTEDLADYALELQQDGLPIDEADRRLAAIRSVTQADVARVARRLLDQPFATVLVGAPQGVVPDRVIEGIPE